MRSKDEPFRWLSASAVLIVTNVLNEPEPSEKFSFTHVAQELKKRDSGHRPEDQGSAVQRNILDDSPEPLNDKAVSFMLKLLR
jgi:hypothetical protein